MVDFGRLLSFISPHGGLMGILREGVLRNDICVLRVVLCELLRSELIFCL